MNNDTRNQNIICFIFSAIGALAAFFIPFISYITVGTSFYMNAKNSNIASAMIMTYPPVTSNVLLISLNMFIFILSFRMLYYSLKPVIIVKQTELPEKAI